MQYHDWLKWPHTYREPTHKEWLQEIAALRKEVEEAKKDFDLFKKTNDELRAKVTEEFAKRMEVKVMAEETERRLALYEKAVEPVRECWDNELARLSEYYWKKESDGPEQAIRDCIRTLETK